MIKWDKRNRVVLNQGKHMSPKELQEFANRVKEESVRQASTLVFTSLILALRDEYGFGEKRLRRVIDKTNEVIESVSRGYLEIDDIRDTIKKECNIDL